MAEEQRAARGYESRDLNVKAAGIFGVGLLALTVFVFVSMGWLYRFLLVSRPGYTVSPPPRAAPEVELGPRLQVAPAEDLAQLRASEEALLGEYAWVDRRAGIVRVPIDRAMEVLAERGREKGRKKAP